MFWNVGGVGVSAYMKDPHYKAREFLKVEANC